MAEAGEKKNFIRNMEPITQVCLAIFLVACIGVAASYAIDHFDKQDEFVEYGDSLQVDYTGAIYDSYWKPSAMIFDTSVKHVGEDSNLHFHPTFSKKSSDYKTTTVTVGSGGWLPYLEQQLVGHKVGETFQVMVPVGEGYPIDGSSDTNKKCTQSAGDYLTFAKSATISKTDFEKFYDVDIDATSGPLDFEYNEMSGVAILNGSMVTYTFNVAVGDEFEVFNDEYYGVVKLSIVEINGNIVSYKLDVTGAKMSGHQVYGTFIDEIDMITVKLFPNITYNIVGYDVTGIIYNTTSSSDARDYIKYMDLYFTITIVSKN